MTVGDPLGGLIDSPPARKANNQQTKQVCFRGIMMYVPVSKTFLICLRLLFLQAPSEVKEEISNPDLFADPVRNEKKQTPAAATAPKATVTKEDQEAQPQKKGTT